MVGNYKAMCVLRRNKAYFNIERKEMLNSCSIQNILVPLHCQKTNNIIQQFKKAYNYDRQKNYTWPGN